MPTRSLEPERQRRLGEPVNHALAGAHAVAGAAAARCGGQAREAVGRIAEQDDRELVLADLETL